MDKKTYLAQQAALDEKAKGKKPPEADWSAHDHLKIDPNSPASDRRATFADPMPQHGGTFERAADGSLHELEEVPDKRNAAGDVLSTKWVRKTAIDAQAAAKAHAATVGQRATPPAANVPADANPAADAAK